MPILKEGIHSVPSKSAQKGESMKLDRRCKDRRTGKDRRYHDATILAPDRRNGQDRRNGKDRRKS